MFKKSLLFSLSAFLILSTAVALICGLCWGDKTSGGIGTLPARDNPPEKGKTTPAALNAKAHALISDFGRVPVYFVPNRGQADNRVNFYVQGDDKTVFFAPDGLTLALSYQTESGSSNAPKRWTVKLDFLGAREDAKPEGMEKTGANISYFRGKPEEWKTGLPAYSRIIYRNLWPGIDLVYKGEIDKLKYEFVVRPGADPSKIRLAYRGAERVALTEEGRLEVTTPASVLEDDIPVAYQEVDGKRMAVPLTYSLGGVTESQEQAVGPERAVYVYGFAVGEYDLNRTLVIDPAMLVYCGYIGGANDDSGHGIALDGSGNVYITGVTKSDVSSFPVTAGPDPTHNGSQDAFIAKINAFGSDLVYCGYIGGTNDDGGNGIAVDDSGNAYIAGETLSTEATFPVTVGPDLTQNGNIDTFVAKVSSSGTDLLYCGYIGGASEDGGPGIAVDDSGNAYVVGETLSTEATFPVTVGPDLVYNGGWDSYVAKVNSSGTGLDYCGYIGGLGHDRNGGFGNGQIAVDGSGNAYVTGLTWSSQATFPDVVGPDLTSNGQNDAYVAKVNSLGTGLVYCGYIGGISEDAGCGIAVDDSGNAYVVGETCSTEATFPVTVGPDLTFGGGWYDVFAAKVAPSGASLIYCGYIGGSNLEGQAVVAVDTSGNAYVAGFANSGESDFPVVDGPDLTINGGWCDAFVAKVNPSGTALIYCGYIGGSGDDFCYGLTVDDSGNAYVCGSTTSDQLTFPIVEGPDLTFNGATDAFVAKVGEIPGPPITSLSRDSANAGDPGFLLSVFGSEFVDGAFVRWDVSARPTTFVSSSELDAEIATADLTTGKIVYVSVRNPDGGVSSFLPFTIHNPMPSIASISPTQVNCGGDGFWLNVQGSNFVPTSEVRWNGDRRYGSYVNSGELTAWIAPQTLWEGGDVQITVYNPPPSGGESNAITFHVSSFTLAASPTSVTVAAGQSATYTIQVTPLYGTFDLPVTFSCQGLPSKCTASFMPTSVTPGAAGASTTLTLTTAASAAAGTSAASFTGAAGSELPYAGLLALAMIPLITKVGRRSMAQRLFHRQIALYVFVCLAVVVIGSCSSGGDGNNPPPYTGTPKGTHTISVQATSGNISARTSITLVVN